MQALFLFLGVSGANAGTMDLGWPPVSGATEYRVHYSATSTVTEASPFVVVPASACTPIMVANCGGPAVGTVECRGTIPNLPDNQPAWVKIRACAGSNVGCSDFSTVQIADDAPRPEILDVVKDASGKITQVTGKNFRTAKLYRRNPSPPPAPSLIEIPLSAWTWTTLTLQTPVAELELTVRNTADEVGGCAPFGQWSATVAPVSAVRRVDTRPAN